MNYQDKESDRHLEAVRKTENPVAVKVNRLLPQYVVYRGSNCHASTTEQINKKADFLVTRAKI